MIDQDKMRALALRIRTCADECYEGPQSTLGVDFEEAANAIDLLLAEVEAAAEDKRRLQWLTDRFIGADFEWNADDDGNGTPVLCIKIDRSTKVYGCLTTTVNEALAQRQGEGS